MQDGGRSFHNHGDHQNQTPPLGPLLVHAPVGLFWTWRRFGLEGQWTETLLAKIQIFNLSKRMPYNLLLTALPSLWFSYPIWLDRSKVICESTHVVSGGMIKQWYENHWFGAACVGAIKPCSNIVSRVSKTLGLFWGMDASILSVCSRAMASKMFNWTVTYRGCAKCMVFWGFSFLGQGEIWK